MNKNHKNIEQQLNKEWKNYGVHINEKGELVAIHEGKEYKIGQATFFTEQGKSDKQERERDKKNLKIKK